jgi:exonuclease-1
LESRGEIQESEDMYYGAIEITPQLYIPIIQYLIHKNIEYVVAPYEADAQLGYLARNNYVDFVISEDGDCLVYGCRCVLFKLKDGIGHEIDMNRLSYCTDFDFCDWTHDMFTYLCILCGCDYLPHLQRVGFVSAYSIVSRGKVPNSIFELRLCRNVTEEYFNFTLHDFQL